MFRDHLWGINCPRNLTLKVGFSPYLNKACNDWNLKLLLQLWGSSKLHCLTPGIQLSCMNSDSTHLFFEIFTTLTLKGTGGSMPFEENSPKIDKDLPWKPKTYFKFKRIVHHFFFSRLNLIFWIVIKCPKLNPTNFEFRPKSATIQNTRFELKKKNKMVNKSFNQR